MAAHDNRVSYRTDGGQCSRSPAARPALQPGHAGASNRPSGPQRAAVLLFVVGALIVGRGLICAGDKIRAATHTLTHAHTSGVFTLSSASCCRPVML